jgi:hypothetical protein
MQDSFSDNLSPSDMKRDQILAAALKILHAMAEQSKPNVPSLPVMLESAVTSFEDISEHTMKKWVLWLFKRTCLLMILSDWGKLLSNASAI